jgi:uncharacterized cupredoxin-like copper-binding protein
MGNGGDKGWKIGAVGLAVLLAALLGPGVATVSAKSAPTRQMSVVKRTAIAASVADVPVAASDVDAIVAEPARAPVAKQRRLRRLKHRDLNSDLILVSADLIKRHHAKRIGSEIEVEVAGKPYVARIERHFHPEGGAIKPWGFHPGVSLFAVE